MKNINRSVLYLIALCIVTTLIISIPTHKTKGQTLPNIVIIIADDLGYGDVSPYNSQITYTPNIQNLANEGVTLTSFYVPVAICSPARASLLTGNYPIQTGINNALFPGDPVGLRDFKTLPSLLGDAGYRTAIFGKWHLGDQFDYYPTNNGFDYAYWMPFGNATPTIEIWENETFIESEPDLALLPENFTSGAINFISESVNAGKPFFLYLPHIWPHKHLFPSNEGQTGEGIYADSVYDIDWMIGQVRSHLQNLGIEEQTIVIFTSDNGPYQPSQLDLVENIPYENQFFAPWIDVLQQDPNYTDIKNPERSAGGSLENDFFTFRPPEYETLATYRSLTTPTAKGTVYEGGVRVPFIIRWPDGNLVGGRIEQNPAIMIDLYTTLASWAGLEVVGDGENIKNLLQFGESRVGDVFYYFTGAGSIMAIRSGDWKLHFRWGLQTKALYNVANDPSEATDLLDTEPAKVQELLSMAKAFQASLIQGPDRFIGTVISSNTENVIFDFDKIHLINQLVVNWPTVKQTKYSVEVSNNLVDWTLIYRSTYNYLDNPNLSSIGITDGGLDILNVPANAGRYVRINCMVGDCEAVSLELNPQLESFLPLAFSN